MDQRAKIQGLSDEYQGLQTELSSLVSARQKLESQQQENKSVQNEFDKLDEDANVFKLVGPVLLKQDNTEAKSTIKGRLDFIEKEIKRIEDNIKDIQGKSEGKRAEIMHIQAQMQEGTS